MRKKSVTLDFSEAFKYPFNNFKRMFNILWVFLPIFGWLALGGYGVRIVKSFIKGEFKGLPEMTFMEDMRLGFFMFLKAIPFVIVYIIADVVLRWIPVIGDLTSLLLSLLIVPILSINFMNKQTVESFFEFDLVGVVFDNLGDYLIAILKTIGLVLIYLVLCIVLVGFPALAFTQNIFLADFYRRNVA